MHVLGLDDEIADVPVQNEDETECFEIWQDNLPTLEVFLSLRTQWNIVASEGRLIETGINYGVLPAVLGMRRDISRKQWQKVFNDIRVMENAALKVMRKLLEAQTT